MKSILIVGYGVVGKNLAEEIKKLGPDIVDKFHSEYNTKQDGKVYDIAFICVDTPYVSAECPCDISAVLDALNENEAKLYVIKSTVLPGMTEKLACKTEKHLIFSPEYYGGTQHCNNFDFAYTVLGGDIKDCHEVVQELQHVYDGRHRFMVTDAKTAELAKYMENCYLATKVSFCTQFWDIANQIGVDYGQLREIFIMDPRVSPSHTFVYDETPYWDSHCLNKDVAAFANRFDAPLIKSVSKFNDVMKEKGQK